MVVIGGVNRWKRRGGLDARFVASIKHFQKLKISNRNRNLDYSYRKDPKKSR